MKPKRFILLALLLLIVQTTFAQKGSFVKPYGLLKYTTFSNIAESIAGRSTVKLEPTWHKGFGINYIYNAYDIFGIELGLLRENSGQKYSGSIEDDVNTAVKDPLDFTSEVGMEQWSIPVLFNFNSRMEDDQIYLSIGAGFKLTYLSNAWMKTDPEPQIPSGGELDVKSLFKSTSASFITSASFNTHVYKDWYITFGFTMSRTIGDIENKSILLDKSIHVAEYYFPVSTKKITKDYEGTRRSTKDNYYAFSIGISYLFKEIK